MAKLRLIRQHDSMQCGVACLAMVCGYYGKRLSQQFLSQRCTPTTEGVSLLAMKDCAEGLGIDVVCAQLSAMQLSQAPLPCILHWHQKHFVVLEKVGREGKRFLIADPGKGKRWLGREEFEKHWLSGGTAEAPTGIAMLLEPTQKFLAMEEPKEGESVSFGFLWRYLAEYRGHFVKIFLGLLVGCVLQLILPFLTQMIVDVGINEKNVKFIWLVLLGEFMIVAGRTVTDFIRRKLLLHVSMRVNISLVSDFFVKLLRLPMQFFDTKLMGDLLQRMGDHGRVQSFLTGQVLGMMFTLLSFVVYGVVLLVYDRLIFGVFVVCSVVYGLWIARFLDRRKVLDYALFEQQAINQNRTYQFVTTMQEIKLQGCERRRRKEWEDTQTDLFALQMQSLKLQQTQEAGSIFINEMKNILITVLAATAVIDGSITLGGMLAIQYIVGQLNSPVEQLMQFIYSLQDVKISLERINEIHNCSDEASAHGSLCKIAEPGGIMLSGVNFKYDRHSPRHTLSEIDLNVPAGKVTAIVGTSGSGKTTLVRLMLGYYPVDSGKIEIGGRNIADYDVDWWRSRCGVVMQDGVIFSESIARNIAVGDGEIDWPRLEEAARVACIHDYVQTLPLRYNTKIGRDGKGLSQGQKQRILIARAVYKNPDFIFLDEATNSLDAKNERQIVENLAKFYRGRTVVVVAHRLSTVKEADQIVVIEGGKVAECGTHASLLANQGAYYTLVKNQLAEKLEF